jgi:hypothetical protein
LIFLLIFHLSRPQPGQSRPAVARTADPPAQTVPSAGASVPPASRAQAPIGRPHLGATACLSLRTGTSAAVQVSRLGQSVRGVPSLRADESPARRPERAVVIAAKSAPTVLPNRGRCSLPSASTVPKASSLPTTRDPFSLKIGRAKYSLAAVNDQIERRPYSYGMGTVNAASFRRQRKHFDE